MTRTATRPAVRAAEPMDGDFEEMPQTSALAPLQGRTAMRIQTQYATAVSVQKARDIDKVLAAVEREASLAFDDFNYSMTFKSKTGPSTIEGVSIDGAMILARNWGNCVTEAQIVEDAPAHWVFSATFIDLETGFTEQRLFRQRKGESHMQGDAERKIDIAFQIGQSKAKRNVIVKAMPTWLIKAAVIAAKKAAETRIKDLPKEIAEVIAAFKSIGVTEEQLVKRIGEPSARWIPRDIVLLDGIGRAIGERLTSVEQEFPKDEPKPEPAKPAEPAETPPAKSYGSNDPPFPNREPGQEG
jgi:hypothetical protein